MRPFQAEEKPQRGQRGVAMTNVSGWFSSTPDCTRRRQPHGFVFADFAFAGGCLWWSWSS